LADHTPQASSTITPVRTAVAGVGGYSGGELARLLLAHPRLQNAKPLFLGRVADESTTGSIPLEALHPQLALGAGRTQPPVQAFSWDLIAERNIDLVFLALPHENSRDWVPAWLDHGVRVIDLSGAWRLRQESNRKVYKLQDADPRSRLRLSRAPSRHHPRRPPRRQSRLLFHLHPPRPGPLTPRGSR
jgi:N-acetyl-gamma-glutamyl-phosphate reductase